MYNFDFELDAADRHIDHLESMIQELESAKCELQHRIIQLERENKKLRSIINVRQENLTYIDNHGIKTY